MKQHAVKTIDYKLLVALTFAVNLPVYVIFSFYRLADVGFSAALAIDIIAFIFLIFLSNWFLKNHSSGFNLINGLLFGFWAGLLTFALDFLFFGLIQNYGLTFLKWFAVAVYFEILIIPPIISYLKYLSSKA